jgi:ABC-type nickel/cobalt efflux system permease component RcnA
MTAFPAHAGDRHRLHARTARRRLAIGATAGLIAVLLLPGLVAAHPLGNFTINHYAGLRIEPDRILLDVVIDQAEIPTFQARLAFDVDGDGELSEPEVEAGRLSACHDLVQSLDLRVGGRTLPTTLTEAGLTFPPGAGGLSTMRTVCGFEAVLNAPLGAGSEIAFADRSFSERIGWREIVVEGSGVSVAPTIADGTLRNSSPSTRLTAYPTNLLAQAPADTELSVVATPGGPTLPPLDIPDADPIVGPGGAPAVSSAPAGAAVVPGGIAVDEIPTIFRSVDLTPVVLFVSLLTAAALGAGHALTPGHGKTLIAAYLVGSRGTPAHAAGLGLSVALSHTLGILVLAGLVVGAQSVLPPELVIRTAPILAAGSIVAIGGWMLLSEGRRRWRTRTAATTADHAHDHDHGHDHKGARAHATTHVHEAVTASGEHSHGGRSHSHLPPPGSTISWRSLFVLGLAGGLIPSANALVILLVSIAAGRPAFGFVLVVAFGLGMAVVMGGIGLAMTVARGRLDRVGASTPLGRASAYLPLMASVVVFSFGVFLTIQAVAGNTTL